MRHEARPVRKKHRRRKAPKLYPKEFRKTFAKRMREHQFLPPKEEGANGLSLFPELEKLKKHVESQKEKKRSTTTTTTAAGGPSSETHHAEL
jgi:hypothetical protein